MHHRGAGSVHLQSKREWRKRELKTNIEFESIKQSIKIMMEKSIPLFIALHCGAQVPAEFLWFFICNLLFVLRLRPQRVFRLTTVCIYCARAPRSRSLLFIRISSIQVIVVVYANASIIPVPRLAQCPREMFPLCLRSLWIMCVPIRSRTKVQICKPNAMSRKMPIDGKSYW